MNISHIVTLMAFFIKTMGGTPETQVNTESYQSIRLTSDSQLEIYHYPQGDSTLVIQTVCAPVCSSCARVINKKGDVIRTIPSPYPNAVFPEAHMLNGELVWTDNTHEILDSEEIK